MFSGKTFLVTGGTGSFGSTFLKKILTEDVKEIRVFSRDEKKQEELRLSLNTSKVKFYIGDVRDGASIGDAMSGVDYVFHAAALKQVPSCEFYPIEAMKTNVIGTDNVINAAVNYGVKKVIVLSTDKAVYPINAMGITKALAEKVMVAKSCLQRMSNTIVCATRYGNVIASRGSVVPLFISQIKSGQELTITDPNMTRFLMTLDESVDLVLYALKHGGQGDIFVQKSPSAKVSTVASAIQDILGIQVGVRTIGTRHGEKLFETLVSREEMARAIDLGKHFRIPADSRDLNYSQFYSEGETAISELDDYTSHNTNILDVDGVKELLSKLDIIREAINA